MTSELTDSVAHQLSETLSVLELHLGESIQTIYLFGSAVYGGLKPLSDIDLLVTVDAPLKKSTREALMLDLLSMSAYPGTDAKRRALEITVLARQDVVPWRHPVRRQLQFGEWLREDIKGGIFEPPMLDHDLTLLLTQVRQRSIALRGPEAHDFFDEVPVADVQRSLLETLSQWTAEPDWKGDEVNIVLTLVRIWYTAMTGNIVSKDAAADWALQRLPDALGHIVVAARDTYLGHAKTDLAAYPQQRADLLSHIRSVVTKKLQ